MGATVTNPSDPSILLNSLASAAVRATACLYTGNQNDRIERAFDVLGTAWGCTFLSLVAAESEERAEMAAVARWQCNGGALEDLVPLTEDEQATLLGGGAVFRASADQETPAVVVVALPHEPELRFALYAAFPELDEESHTFYVELLRAFAENIDRVISLPVRIEHVQQRIRIDEALVQISHMLVASREIDFESLLSLIGRATGVDAAYFVRIPLDADTLVDTRSDSGESPTVFRWTKGGQFQIEQVVSPGSDASIGGVLAGSQVDLRSQHVDAVPVLSLGDRLFGYIGFEYGTDTARWREEDKRVLGVLGDILATFFERKLAEQALQESEERWRRLVEHHPEPILLTSAQVIHYVNRAAVQVLGAQERDDLVGSSLHDFVSAEDFESLDKRMIELERGGLPEPYEHEMIRFDGEERIVESASVPIMYEGKSFILTVMRDVTAQRLAEEGYRTFVETITEAICRIDLERPVGRDVLPLLQRKHILTYGYVAECNHVMAEMLHRPQRDVVGESFVSVFPHIRASVLDEFIDSGYRLRNREFTVFRKGRSPRHFVLNAVGTLERGRLTRIWGSCIEVTERVELERRIVGALEEQQQEIGRDLHDGVGQLLTGVRMLTQNLVERFREDDHPAFEVAQKVARFAEEATRHVRDIYRGLTPAQLYHEGLSATLAELAHTLDALPNIRCEFVHSGGTEIDNRDVKLHLFRIAQEAVNNALKHSRAENIRIYFGREGDTISLRVSDDGVGLEAPSAQRGTSIGFDSMRYRAGAIGATLHVTTQENGGTTIECRLSTQR
jgi:PAS domain S-box-containing protein